MPVPGAIDLTGAHRRARAKLAAIRARSAPAPTPVAPPPPSAWPFFVAVAVFFGCYLVMASGGPLATQGVAGIIIFAVCWLVIMCGPLWMVVGGHVARRRRRRYLAAAAPSAPEAAIRALFSLAVGDPVRAYGLLPPEDRDEWVRTTAFWTPKGALAHPNPTFSDAANFGDYWRALSGRQDRALVSADCNTLGIDRLDDDIARVDIEFGLTTRSTRTLKVSGLLLGLAMMLAGFAAVPSLMASLGKAMPVPGFVFGLAAVPLFGLGIYGLILSSMSQPLGTVRVSKLAVRVSGRWQPFNGELMGQEEADPSWLEHP